MSIQKSLFKIIIHRKCPFNTLSCPDVSAGHFHELFGAEFLISFEAWAKLAQKWLVCVPLRIHLEPIN